MRFDEYVSLYKLGSSVGCSASESGSPIARLDVSVDGRTDNDQIRRVARKMTGWGKGADGRRVEMLRSGRVGIVVVVVVVIAVDG